MKVTLANWHGTKKELAELDEISKQHSTQKDTIGKMLKDLDKQEKIINAMALDISIGIDEDICRTYSQLNLCHAEDRNDCIECIKQYYEKKVSEDNE